MTTAIGRAEAVFVALSFNVILPLCNLMTICRSLRVNWAFV
jgi:hypothetical protein